MKKLIALSTLAVLFTGCASVPLASQQSLSTAKEFKQPAADSSGLYVYRNSIMGAALKKDIKINGECLGESV